MHELFSDICSIWANSFLLQKTREAWALYHRLGERPEDIDDKLRELVNEISDILGLIAVDGRSLWEVLQQWIQSRDPVSLPKSYVIHTH